MMFRIALFFAVITGIAAFSRLHFKAQTGLSKQRLGLLLQENIFEMAEKEPEKEGFERLKEKYEKSKNDTKFDKAPIYEPGSYPIKLLAALAYLIPIVDASDLGKYIFEVYPEVGGIYNTLFGTLAGVYNGVPFLPFAIFFVMSYISRAPTFPVEVRFHFAQAFMVSLIQFVPSFGLGLLEKGGVPGVAVLYNTAFMWVMICCLTMQTMLVSPISRTKNPFIFNVVNWSMRYMNYSPSMSPRGMKKK